MDFTRGTNLILKLPKDPIKTYKLCDILEESIVEVKRRGVSTIPSYLKYCDGVYGAPRWALKTEDSAQPFLWMNLSRDDSLVFLDGEAYLNRGVLKAIKLRTATPDYINGMSIEDFREAFHKGFLDDGTEFLNKAIYERVYREIVPTLRSL